MNNYYGVLYFKELINLKRSIFDKQFISKGVSSSSMDLNPHQINAALFALKSPFSKGVILADEVGLGKTIEAGLVIAQKWAENKRNILLILPSSLRNQWKVEMSEKFRIDSIILDNSLYSV